MQFFHFILILMVLFMFSMNANGTVWTIDSNPGNHAANFTSLQAAHDAATDGDTLYISGFNVNYGNLTVSKKLHIFGPGYFLDENDSTQANTYPARIVDWVGFASGSENSQITGCFVNAIYISADSITVKRNRIYSYGYYSVYVQNSADYIDIKQNYIYSGMNGIELNPGSNNINITNNFISTGTVNHGCISGNETNTNIMVENNILYGNLTIYNAAISNNIYRDGTYTGNSSNTVLNNICNGTQFETTGDNQQNVDMNTVFVASGTTDGQWRINPAGPAAGAGTFGTDIGMFGGITPYVLSGIPEIPTIYYFYSPSNASQTLQIRAKIKSRR